MKSWPQVLLSDLENLRAGEQVRWLRFRSEPLRHVQTDPLTTGRPVFISRGGAVAPLEATGRWLQCAAPGVQSDSLRDSDLCNKGSAVFYTSGASIGCEMSHREPERQQMNGVFE